MSSQIRILRGAREALRHHESLRSDGSSRLVLSADPSLPRAFGALRALLPMLRARLGDVAVDEALERERTWLSLSLHGLDARLTEDERARRAESCADPDGFLSHNSFVSEPHFRAWVDALQPLVCEPALCVAVPDVTAHDADSVAVLVALWTRAPLGQRFQLCLGVPDEEVASDALGSAGPEAVRTQIELLALRPDVSVARVEPTAFADPRLRVDAAALDPLDGDLEGRVALALASDAPDVDAALEDLRKLFRGFGFGAVLRLGLALLEHGSALPPPRRAELHALVALSAYNRQVHTGDNAGLTSFLGEHFAEALKLEPDPARRSHLCYRLCINRGRRAGAVEASLVDAEAAVSEARDPAVPRDRAAFLEAWARNGRAYVLARLGRLSEARDDMREALELARSVPADGAVPRAEREYSLAVLLDNSAELALRAGDHAETRALQSLLTAHEVALSGGVRASPWRWTGLHLRAFDPRAVLSHALDGVRVATRALDPLSEDTFRMIAGDACYRCGDAAGALEHFRAARRIRVRAEAPAQLRAVDVNLAMAALRAGDPGAIDDAVGAALDLCRDGDDALRAELLAMRAMAAALRGEADVAELAMNDAIARAVATGVRDVMLRVARRAGEACAAMGLAEAAASAFAQALALGDVPGDKAPPPADLASSLLWLREIGAADDGVLPEVSALLARALDDPDAWWELPRWAAAVSSGAAPGEPEAVATLRRAIASRDGDLESPPNGLNIDALAARSRPCREGSNPG